MTVPTGGAIGLTVPITHPATPDFLRGAVADFVRKRNRPVDIIGGPWNVVWRDLVKAMESGRSHAGIPFWRLVEERLATALAAIWADLKRDPQQDLDMLIGAQLEPLADRFDLLLSR